MLKLDEISFKPSFDVLIQLLENSPGTELITPSDEGYAQARLVYNRMHDFYPRLIIRTLNINSLRQVIAFALTHDIVLAIRGGGHHIGGFGTCHDGIVLDFSPFKGIHLDEDRNIVSVQPGVRLADLDKFLTAIGYVVPTGTISDTGLAGLSLGGGIGWLVGKYGLTCDQLCGADVLLANGQVVQAEAPEHKQLLWAMRGGGGNFGIVLNFRYRLNPLPKTICGMGIVAWEQAQSVLTDLIHYLKTPCPPSMTLAPIFTKDSSANLNLRIDFCCADGSWNEVEQLLSLSKDIQWTEVKEWNFAAWQKAFDDSFLPPMRGYWKAAYFSSLSSEVVQTLFDAFAGSPVQRCTIMIEHLHGAFKKYDQNTSAFPLRDSNFGIVVAARWTDAQDDKGCIHWVRNTFEAIDPKENSATYLNYSLADDRRALNTLLSATRSQIASVKSHYDPKNIFKRNHNVLPESN